MNAPSKTSKNKTSTNKNVFCYKGGYFCHRELGEPVGEWRLLGVYSRESVKAGEPKLEHYVLSRMVDKPNRAQTHVLSGVSRKEAEAELKSIASSPSAELKEAA